MGCFWGAERMFWQAPGLHDCRRLRGRPHAEPDVPGGLHRPHGPQRGRPRGLRHVEDELRRDAPHLLGGPRPDPGHAPGKRRRHAVPLGDLLDVARRSATPRSRRATCSRRSSRAPATARSRPRSSRPARSTTPRTTTSSTSRRTRTATAGSVAGRLLPDRRRGVAAAPAGSGVDGSPSSARCAPHGLCALRFGRSVIPLEPASRVAMYTGMIETTITKSATTFTIGCSSGRARSRRSRSGASAARPR